MRNLYVSLCFREVTLQELLVVFVLLLEAPWLPNSHKSTRHGRETRGLSGSVHCRGNRISPHPVQCLGQLLSGWDGRIWESGAVISGIFLGLKILKKLEIEES